MNSQQTRRTNELLEVLTDQNRLGSVQHETLIAAIDGLTHELKLARLAPTPADDLLGRTRPRRTYTPEEAMYRARRLVERGHSKPVRRALGCLGLFRVSEIVTNRAATRFVEFLNDWEDER